jgi:hypothetical protein
MPSITGSFDGRVTRQDAMPVGDRPNHEVSLAEVAGTQQSVDPMWNNAKITYWGVTDIVDGKGQQRGYYHNTHGDKGHEWGTFEARVNAAGGTMTAEGTWKITGGDGQYLGATGNGTFKTAMKSETEIGCTWEGAYELARVQAG